MSYSWFVAWKHIRKKKGLFVNLSTYLSIAGIIVGVMALDITLAVMNGFDKDLKDKILGMQPHIIIFNDRMPIKYNEVIDRISLKLMVSKPQFRDAGVKMTPFAEGQGIIRNKDIMTGIQIKGIDQKTEADVTNLPMTIKEGKFSFDNNGVLLGRELAKNLGLKIGDECGIISGYSAVAGKFRVNGIFETGLYAFDSGIAYVSLSGARNIFNLKEDESSNIGIKIKDIYQADKITAMIQEELQYPYIVRSWGQMNRNLFAALKLEKTTMFILLSLIILVAGFGMANTMIMNIMKKVREIGIIQSLGATPGMIRNIFMLEGSTLGLAGISIGTILGFLGSVLLKKYKFVNLPADVYYLTFLPVQIRFSDFAAVAGIAFLIVFIFSIYPAHVASRIKPAEALRQEQ